MQHRKIKGRIDYITDDVGVMGREWFTHSIHSDGARTMRALTEMDDDDLMRDVTFSVDANWIPSVGRSMAGRHCSPVIRWHATHGPTRPSTWAARTSAN